MKIYTKKGDKGKTNLFGTDKRISKSSKRVKSYGEIDELNSFIGLALSGDEPEEFSSIIKELNKIQNDLFIICLLYTSPSPRDRTRSRMPSSA